MKYACISIVVVVIAQPTCDHDEFLASRDQQVVDCCLGRSISCYEAVQVDASRTGLVEPCVSNCHVKLSM